MFGKVAERAAAAPARVARPKPKNQTSRVDASPAPWQAGHPSWVPPLANPLLRPFAPIGRRKADTTNSQPPKVRFVRLDFETGMTAVFKTRVPSYRSPFFRLRSIPAKIVPPPPPSPFPPMAPHTGQVKTYTDRPVQFGILVSKKIVSNFAVERNRARTRFKDVVASVLRTKEGKGLVSSANAYLAALDASIHSAPREEIEREVLKGMRFLQEQNARPTPSGPSRRPF